MVEGECSHLCTIPALQEMFRGINFQVKNCPAVCDSSVCEPSI